MKNYYIYIVTNKKNGTLYIGVTSDLIKRVWEHKNKVKDSFSKKYSLGRLVYYEHTTDVYSALNREKRLKRYKREWKIALIQKCNPDWLDLYDEIVS